MLKKILQDEAKRVSKKKIQELKKELARFDNIWSMVFLVTERCNSECRICLRYREEQAELDLKAMRKIIDILKFYDIKRITFTGGEPLLNKDLYALIRYAHEKGLVTSLSTNGTLVTEEFIQQFKGILAEINFSYDGLTEEVFSGIAAYGTAANIKKIESLFKYIRETSDIALKVTTVVCRENLKEIMAIGERLLEGGVQLWKLDQFYKVAENKDTAKTYEVPTRKFRKIITAARAYFSGKPLEIIDQGSVVKSKNQVFFISPAGNVIQNKNNQNIKSGNILLEPWTYLANPAFGSNTPVQNYLNKLPRLPEINNDYYRKFMTVHRQRLGLICREGQSDAFTPHTDYGANILVPEYIRNLIDSHFAQVIEPRLKQFAFFIDPLLYSCGLQGLGDDIKDQDFYKLEQAWAAYPQTELLVKGPYIGEACLYYMLMPQNDQEYFRKIKLNLRKSLKLKDKPKMIDDTMFGWINVGRFFKKVSAQTIMAYDREFSAINARPLASFNPYLLGALKSNWEDTPFDLQTVVAKYPV